MSYRHATTACALSETGNRSGGCSSHRAPCGHADLRQPSRPFDVLELARQSGMLVMLDGQIGRERYQSVAGSLAALERFADALCRLVCTESDG